MDLESVADEVYAVPPAEFTRLRDERAAQARREGDRDLSVRIKQLKRPSRPAWLINVLGRQRPDDLRQLLELSEALHAAQDQLDPAALRQLSAQRHQVVAALSREAVGLARAIGEKVTDAVAREVEQTLDAALADPSAAQQVRSGRLTAAISYAGFGAAGSGTTSTASRRAPAKADLADGAEDRRQAEAAAAEAAAAEEQKRRAAEQAAEARRVAEAELAAAKRDASSAVAAAAAAAEAAAEAIAERDARQAAADEAEQRVSWAEQRLAGLASGT